MGVTVNYGKCDELIKIITSVNLPVDKEEETVIELEQDTLKNLYFVIVAICHQTSPLQCERLNGFVRGKQYFGWDYLREKWLFETKNKPEIVYPKFLSKITGDQVEEILRDENGLSTIFDPSGRAELLRDLGNKMEVNEFTSVENIFKKSKGYINSNSINVKGLLELLGNFTAYSDPVEKKSIFFLSLMKNNKFWSYEDEENLGPPVDYHEMRGHLRFGSVEIVDECLYSKLLNNVEISEEEDIQIRRAVFDAILYISKKLEISPSVLHYFFWNVFRSCCNGTEVHCYECIECRLPERYKDLTDGNCIFQKYCASKGKSKKINEPKVNTIFY